MVIYNVYVFRLLSICIESLGWGALTADVDGCAYHVPVPCFTGNHCIRLMVAFLLVCIIWNAQPAKVTTHPTPVSW